MNNTKTDCFAYSEKLHCRVLTHQICLYGKTCPFYRNDINFDDIFKDTLKYQINKPKKGANKNGS